LQIRITVPVYNAFEATGVMLASLLKHNSNDDVLIINDASTDDRIKGLLADLPSNWELIHNEHNLGFVKTANIGLQSSKAHSVLLNADTIVSSGWLERFKQAIVAVADLGTATPWSNNAEICSLPETLTVNTVPDDIDQLAGELNLLHEPQYPELPTAVGFCMLITARAKQQVGYFDAKTFGLGYGEENDYSLRVKQHGMRNVLVDNCYVAHVGNQSFKDKDLQPNQATMDRLLNIHPSYGQLIENFIKKDPLVELRESIIAKISAF